MKYLLCFFSLLLVFSCKGQKEPIVNNLPEIPLEKRVIYTIGVTIQNPFEVYINDIKAEDNPLGGNMVVDINPYVLNNGKYKVKIRFHAPPTNQFFSQKDMDRNLIELARYIKGQEEGIEQISILPLPKIKAEVPFIDVEWEVELAELPYELEGWSKGQDLSKMDKKVLENKVVNHYEKLRNILNDGNADEWMELISKREYETIIFNYTNSEEAKLFSENNYKKVTVNTKNNMQNIDSYQLNFYAQGKIVSLERTDKENKGEGILRTLEPDGAVRIYDIKLYLPEGSDEFVIIRK